MSNCDWIKDGKGNITGATTYEGGKSQLFVDLEQQFGLEKAVELYAVSRSDDFQDVVATVKRGVIPTEEDAISLANQYKQRFEAIKAKEPNNYWSADVPSYDIILEAAKEGRIATTEGAMAIVAQDGNMFGLLKDDNSVKGVSVKLDQIRLKLGGIKKDNYDGYLTKLYEKTGFKVISRMAFNTKFAPPSWKVKVHGKPDVVFMVYDPNNKLVGKEKYFNKDQYDEALNYRDSFVQEAKNSNPYYTQKEPTAQEVISFVAEQNKTTAPLTPKQKTDLQNLVLSVGEYNPKKLIDLFFDSEGLFKINTKELIASKYYSNYEALKIAEDIELQNTVKESLEALKNNVETLGFIANKGELLETVNTFNSFGKMQVLNPNIVKKELIQELGGLNRPNFEDTIQELPYQNVNKDELFSETSQYIEAEVYTEKEGVLVNDITNDTQTLIEQTAKIIEDDNFKNSLETSNITEQYEEAVLERLGLDITGLSEKLFDAKLVMAIQEFVKEPTKVNTEILTEEYNRVFEIDVSPKKEKIKVDTQYTGYVKLETKKTEEEVFEEVSLIKTNIDDIYLKVVKKPLNELYADVATHFKEIKDLKSHVQNKIKDLNFVNSENAEAVVLYKMYFQIQPTDISYAIEQIKKGVLLWNGDILSPRVDLEMTWADIRKGEQDLLRGKKTSVPATRLVQALNKSKNQGGYRYKTGTGGENQRMSQFVTLEDIERSENEYGLSEGEQEQINLEEYQKQKTKQLSKFTGNYDYLTRKFTSDFYVQSVKERNKNSDKWLNFYSNFGVNGKGLYLKNEDELTIQNILFYADENLKQYSLLSKQLPDLTSAVTEEQEYNSQIRRDNATNFPESIKPFKGEMFKISTEELILKNTIEEFVKIGDSVYEIVETKEELSHYVRIAKSEGEYNVINTEKSQVENKLEKYLHLANKPNSFTTTKKYLTKEEKEIINEDFNC